MLRRDLGDAKLRKVFGVATLGISVLEFMRLLSRT